MANVKHTTKHTHNAPKTIWCICNQDGTIKDFDDRKELFKYAYDNNLYGNFDDIWIEEKELKDERFDYYETVDYEELDLYKIRTCIELDICDMKTDNTNKTPAELKAEINNKYGVNAVYYDTDSILCDTEKQNVCIHHDKATDSTTCYIKAYYDGKELTIPYNEYKCKECAIEYIHNLFMDRVIPYETLFILYYGKHVETITIEIVLDTPDLLQCNTGYVNEGLKRDNYKIVCEGLKRLCSLIDDSHKCIVSLVTANNTHDFVIFKSKFEGLWTFYSEYKATMQTPETFARWLYHNTFTHKIVLKYWHTIKEGDTK